MTEATPDDRFKSASLPEGEYAIAELLGHRTLIGRVTEVERFGTKMLSIEPIFQGRLLPAILHGGSSIYGLTPCTREVAGARAPTKAWQLPGAVAATLPQELIESEKAAAEAEEQADGMFYGDDA